MSNVTEFAALRVLGEWTQTLTGAHIRLDFVDVLPGGAVGSYSRKHKAFGVPTIELRRDLLKNAEELLTTWVHEIAHHLQGGCADSCARGAGHGGQAEFDAEVLARRAVDQMRRSTRAKGMGIADLFQPRRPNARYRIVTSGARCKAVLISE